MQVGKPFLTYYDDAAGERTELSYATFANWVEKTANWLRDERDVAPGDVVTMDRTDHWLSVVLAFAAWRAGGSPGPGGVAVTTGEVADEVLVQPDRFDGGADLPDVPGDPARRLVAGDVVDAALAAYRGGGSIVFGAISDPDRVAEVERATR